MRAALIAMSIAAAGCGTKMVDPCAGQSGTCLAVQIVGSGSVTKVSGATVHVTGDGIDRSATLALEGGGTADLPVALAILFSNITSSSATHIDVVGLLNGAPVGYGGVDATITPGKHSTAQVQLTPVAPSGNDLAGVDGDQPDMASTDLMGYVPLTVQLAGTGTGSVSATGLTCAGASCAGMYPPHSTVTLAAVPAANADFTGWSGAGCVGTSSCVVTLDQPTSLTATFDWKFVPSHVSPSAYKSNAANLSGVTAIDTHNLTINGTAPAAGITFVIDSGIAVMSVGSWSVSSSITVTGDAPLVVVAAGAVTFASGQIHVEAQGISPGPGGNAACSATGARLVKMGEVGSGGGGEYGGGASAGDLPAGMTYGDKVTDFCGGAPGAGGSHYNNLDNACANSCVGGGGGGAVQISSATSITIQNGMLSAGGGGGAPSCAHNQPAPSFGQSHCNAAGGGAGGLIFLEAPTIAIGTVGTVGIWANGGGGGGTSGVDATATPNPGSDALKFGSAAPGGQEVRATEASPHSPPTGRRLRQEPRQPARLA